MAELERRRPVRVKWINGLLDSNGDFLAHLLPVDQTLHLGQSTGRARRVATGTAAITTPTADRSRS